MDILILVQVSSFIILSIFITIVSWRPLHNIKHHGFYRFFAFESVGLLIIINIPYWFINPFSLLHIVSWALLILSLVVVFPGFYLLKKKGGHRKRDVQTENYEFENTTSLVTTGIYKYIRHPLYCSILLVAIGALFKNVTTIGVVLTVVAITSAIATAKIEEKENLQFFGTAYSDYIKTSKMFIPFIF